MADRHRAAELGHGGIFASFAPLVRSSAVILIVDVPDRASVAALAMTVGAGSAATCKTTVLLTPEEIDRAADVNPTYRTPGS